MMMKIFCVARKISGNYDYVALEAVCPVQCTFTDTRFIHCQTCYVRLSRGKRVGG